MPDIIIANITWNPTDWKNVYTNRKAGHRYAKNHPGHESLNFKFDKKDLDSNQYIYGFFQSTNSPVKFNDGGVIIFYSRDTDENKGKIVGIYGNVKILKEKKETPWDGFENNVLLSNVKSDKNLSILFPIPLDSKKYFQGRAVPQVGYTYLDSSIAKNIIADEIRKINKSGKLEIEFKKLLDIYKYVTGYEYMAQSDTDSIEQEEIEEIYVDKSREDIIKELANLKNTDPVMVELKSRSYKRDNKTIVQLKKIRNFECQICGKKIKIKNDKFYIEAAHITPKFEKGNEMPENILILCPNHHKEFDLGERTILEHSKKRILFNLNGEEYNINLELK